MKLYEHQAAALEATKDLNRVDTKFKRGKDHLFYKHGLYRTRLYGIWSNMKTRCYTETYKLYKYYGGRGITVCDEWKNDFKAFYNWSVTHGYADNLTIDRIDNDGNYCPSNCRWVTMAEQCRNRRCCHKITFGGKTQTVSEWSIELGIKRQTLERRINNLGWTIERAFTEPVKKGVVK